MPRPQEPEPPELLGSPVIGGSIDGTRLNLNLDCGAVVTVLKKGRIPGPTPPPSRLRLKGVNPGTQILHGPRQANIQMGDTVVPWTVYEADIDDDCLLGADFIHKYKVHLDPDEEVIRFRPHPNAQQVVVPFKWEHSSSKGSFDSGRVYYQVRVGKHVRLRPYESKTIKLRLNTDSSIDHERQSLEERHVLARTISANYCPSPQENLSHGSKDYRVTPECSTQMTGETAQMDASNVPDLDAIHLGVITNPIDYIPITARVPDGVQIRSGVIPCINAPVDIEIVNMSDNFAQLPHRAVIAEVYLMNPTSYNNTCEEAEEVETVVKTVKARMTKLKTNNDALYNDLDAVIDKEPKLPPIPPDKPLPPDLQDLVDRCQDLSEEEKHELESLLRTHHDIFAKDNLSFGKCPWMQFTIDTGNHPPIKQRARPVPIHYRQAVKEQFLKYLECGAVVPSNSAWASPILCVLKKTGEIRVCIDYRRLNSITRIPATPIPRTQDLLEKLAGNKWYVHTDVAWGYHNVEIHPDDRCKTAVILPDDLGLPSRQFEFTRLSFGLSAAPGQFQAITDKLIRPPLQPNEDNDLGEAVGVYLDDVCIAGDEFKTMIQRIKALFNRLRAAGMLLKAKKCFFFQKELKFLGHKISKEGIGQDEEKVEQILHWPKPENVTELRSFLGLTTYYSKFLRNMAEVASPLYRLLHQDVSFVWARRCQEAFEKLKEMITTAPILGVPDLSQGSFIVDCDASQNSIGAVLSQIQHGSERPLHFWSQTLNKAQKNYCTTHKELLAMVESVLRFHQYLAGAPFIIRTDHSSLQWLKSFKNPTGKLSRWIEKLASYQFQIIYRRGQDQGNADAMSRRPSRPCDPNCKTCKKMENHEKLQEADSVFLRWAQIEPQWLTQDELRKEQCLDQNIMPILVAVQEKKRPDFQDVVEYGPITRCLWLQFNSLEIRDGLLCRRFESPSGLEHLHTYQIILPQKRVKEVIKKLHESPGFGNHFGVSRTYKNFRRSFYWPQAWDITREVIQECTTCCAFKGPGIKTKVPMKIFREGTLFGRWHVDLCGPFHRTPEGYTHICVAVEAFSSWPCIIPLKSEKAADIAEALVTHVFSIFGAPTAVKTDQGKPLISALMKEIMAIYGIRDTQTTKGHPQGNGKVERFIETLKLHLGMMINEMQDDWPKHLPLIGQAYRSTPGIFKYSPFEILFGMRMRTPLDLERGAPPNSITTSDPNKYPAKIREILEKIHQEIRNQMKEATTNMKKRYDQRATLAPFKPGDTVWYYNRDRKKGKTTKLIAPWQGPFIVVNTINDCVARIQNPTTKKMLVVHMDKLASYRQTKNPMKSAWLTLLSP